jgi:hypothetical protein
MEQNQDYPAQLQFIAGAWRRGGAGTVKSYS